jgi:hypothetical protein
VKTYPELLEEWAGYRLPERLERLVVRRRLSVDAFTAALDAAEAERDRLIGEVKQLIAMNERMTDEEAELEERCGRYRAVLEDLHRILVHHWALRRASGEHPSCPIEQDSTIADRIVAALADAPPEGP